MEFRGVHKTVSESHQQPHLYVSKSLTILLLDSSTALFSLFPTSIDRKLYLLLRASPREKLAYRHSVYPHRRLKSTITTPPREHSASASTIHHGNKNKPTPPPKTRISLQLQASPIPPCLRPSASPTERVDPPLRLPPLHLVLHHLPTERRDCQLRLRSRLHLRPLLPLPRRHPRE